jgi:hypothetical protein
MQSLMFVKALLVLGVSAMVLWMKAPSQPERRQPA